MIYQFEKTSDVYLLHIFFEILQGYLLFWVLEEWQAMHT